jgi:glucose uptake protein GlcU
MILGFVYAVISAIFNGSFTSPFKGLDTAPIVFQLYFSIGVFISSLFVLPFLRYNDNILDDDGIGTSFEFTGLGMVAGIICVIAVWASFHAVDRIGVALGQGIWGGMAILVSYLWGVVAFHETPHILVLSIIGVIALIFGVVVIAQSENIANKYLNSPSRFLEETLLAEGGDEEGGTHLLPGNAMEKKSMLCSVKW